MQSLLFHDKPAVKINKEDLAELEGLPLWIEPVSKKADWEPHWAILKNNCYVVANSIQSTSKVYFFYLTDYDKEWVAYSYEPLDLLSAIENEKKILDSLISQSCSQSDKLRKSIQSLTDFNKESENSSGCSLCNGKTLDGVSISTTWGKERISLVSGGAVPEEERFSYCPKCGRPLKKKLPKNAFKVFDADVVRAIESFNNFVEHDYSHSYLPSSGSIMEAIKALQFMLEHGDINKALELACNDAADEQCPYELGLYECKECDYCAHDSESHTDSHRDAECWREYYMKKVQEQEK